MLRLAQSSSSSSAGLDLGQLHNIPKWILPGLPERERERERAVSSSGSFRCPNAQRPALALSSPFGTDASTGTGTTGTGTGTTECERPGAKIR